VPLCNLSAFWHHGPHPTPPARHSYRQRIKLIKLSLTLRVPTIAPRQREAEPLRSTRLRRHRGRRWCRRRVLDLPWPGKVTAAVFEAHQTRCVDRQTDQRCNYQLQSKSETELTTLWPASGPRWTEVQRLENLRPTRLH